MAEFYSYAERQAGNQIDWSKIGSDVTKTLNEVVDIREKKKAAIDEETNKNLETLQNAPKGEDTDVNGWTINAANDLTQGLLLQNRLLKSGKSSVKDYTLYMANTKSGTTQAFNVANEYQKQFSLKMERMKSQDPATRSQALEWTSMGYLEGFGKLSDSKLIQDPLTGQISVGIMETNADGIRVLTPKVMAVNDLYKSVAQKYDYFDSKAATGGVAKLLADVVRTEIKAGGIGTKGEIITTEDALQKTNTLKALEDGVNSFLTNPYNISSVLTEDLGAYNPVYSEEQLKLDPERNFLVRVDKSGTLKPEFSEKQIQTVRDYLIRQTKAQVEEKIKKEVFQSAAVDQEQLSIARKNANRTTTTSDGGETDYGTAWKEYVTSRVPNIANIYKTTKGGMQDEEVIRQLNQQFQGLGLKFLNGGSGTESVIIEGSDGAYADRSLPIKLNDPTAQAQITDYIMRNKAEKGKELISVGVINKNAAPQSGKVYGGVGADGKIIWK